MRAHPITTCLRRITATTVAAVVFSASACMADSPVGSGPWLLDSLQRLADEGALFEPSRIEEALYLKVIPFQQEVMPQSLSCASPSSTRSQIVTRYASQPTWLKPTAEGVQGMVVPEFTINRRAVVSGDPKFSYIEATLEPCSDRYDRLALEREATLEIGNLPTFACFQRPDLERRFSVKDRITTDGVDHITYDVPTNDQRAAKLDFTFRFGAPCAVSVRLEQSYREGYRFQRAESKWQTCRNNAERRYCTTHGPVGWLDEGARSLMSEVVIEVCGSLSSFYDKEPALGPIPPRLERPNFNTGDSCPQ